MSKGGSVNSGGMYAQTLGRPFGGLRSDPQSKLTHFAMMTINKLNDNGQW